MDAEQSDSLVQRVTMLGKILVYPSHAAATTCKTLKKIMAENEGLANLFDIPSYLGALVLAGAGAFCYYKLYEAGCGEALVIPIATNLIDLGYHLRHSVCEKDLQGC